MKLLAYKGLYSLHIKGEHYVLVLANKTIVYRVPIKSMAAHNYGEIIKSLIICFEEGI